MVEDINYKWKLHKLSELRIIVGSKGTFSFKILDGYAEVFGYELINDRVYKVNKNTNMSIITWKSCTIEANGYIENYYVCENASVTHLNFHYLLQTMRENAAINQTNGPIVLICGNADVGKSTLVNTLLNYSTRFAYPLVYVDLDIGQGQLLPPGNIGAVVVDNPFFLYEEKSTHSPISFFYGSNNIDSRPKLYQHYLHKLAKTLNNKLHTSQQLNQGGVIINTCGYVVHTGLDMLLRTIEYFNVNIAVVIDNDLLYYQLKDIDHIKVVHMPKSGGVCTISRDMRVQNRKNRITQYFYGIYNELKPHSIDIPFDQIQIFRVGIPNLSSFCVPYGVDVNNVELECYKIEITQDLQYSLCGISSAKSFCEIPHSNVHGFVVITNIDMEQNIITLLTPGQSPLPSSVLMVGDIKYMDIQ